MLVSMETSAASAAMFSATGHGTSVSPTAFAPMLATNAFAAVAQASSQAFTQNDGSA